MSAMRITRTQPNQGRPRFRGGRAGDAILTKTGAAAVSAGSGYHRLLGNQLGNQGLVTSVLLRTFAAYFSLRIP